MARDDLLSMIPYPPVFRDWRSDLDCRIGTLNGDGGVIVETWRPEDRTWRRIELTEDDACLLAASLLLRAGRKKLARRVLRRLAR